MSKRKTAQFSALLDAMDYVKSADSAEFEAREQYGQVSIVSIDKLRPSIWQPRQKIDKKALKALADSISLHGVTQPLIVRTRVDNQFDIIAGERRWRAAKLAKLDTVPVIVRDDWDDKKAALIALLDNIQREDLSFIERAHGYKKLTRELEISTNQLAEQLGLSASHTRRIISLLELPENIQNYIQQGLLEGTLAIELLPLKTRPELASKIAKQAIDSGYSLKKIRAIVSQAQKNESDKKSKSLRNDLIKKTQGLLSKSLDSRVSVRYNEETKKGSVVIQFQELNGLTALVEKLAETSKN